MRWFVEWTRFRLVLATTISSHKRCQSRYSQRVAVGFGNCLYRRIQRLSTETIIFTARRGVVAFHDEWVIAINHKSLDTPSYTLQRVNCKRLFAVKYRWCRNGPVDAFSSCPPCRQFTCQHRGRFRVTMRSLRPDNGFIVATHQHKESLADRRRTIITGTKFAIFDLIPEASNQPFSLFASRRYA
ncbi:Uncharacterised protein [Klebsiella variicola]|nr:Uncharacterised protein [Klebsiella variicola]SLX06673.1 Uncharacterised protein [Klebsiella variicola]